MATPSGSTLVASFRATDTSNYPDVHTYTGCLDRALWVLLVAKEKLRTPRLSAQEIVDILVQYAEISSSANAVIMALNRAGNKVHVYRRSTGNNFTTYEVMDVGRKHLLGLNAAGVDVLHFVAGKKYTSKRLLAERVLAGLKGVLRIVDTYCGQRTLDLLKEVQNPHLKLITRLANISKTADRTALRGDIRDFKAEFTHAEFRDLANAEIHDRYILSNDSIILLGHGLKDLGNKESFVIVLPKSTFPDLHRALVTSFEQRWLSALPL
jgi:hypothetical protein